MQNYNRNLRKQILEKEMGKKKAKSKSMRKSRAR